jgi:acetoin utilization deacetylase AcuC-like enzyme
MGVTNLLTMEHVGIIYDDVYLTHDTKNHPENANRLRSTISRLKNLNIYGPQQMNHFQTISPRLATTEEIEWVHPSRFVNLVKTQTKKARTSRNILYLDSFGGSMGETVASPGTYEASLKATGGNFQGIDSIFNGEINRSFVLCRPPGHHSNIANARGFCVFNNIILAAEYLFRKKKLNKVAIIDFDAHAGNGTEEILDTMSLSGEVLFISLHQHPDTLYPGTCYASDIGRGSQKGKTINVTFYPYSGQECIRNTFQQIINPIVSQFAPEFILVSAGYDGHHSDPLTAMGYMDQTYSYMMTEIVKLANASAQGRIQCTLEGGYNLEAISNSIANTLSIMAGESSPCEEDDIYVDNVKTLNFLDTHLFPTLREKLTPYWEF